MMNLYYANKKTAVAVILAIEPKHVEVSTVYGNLFTINPAQIAITYNDSDRDLLFRLISFAKYKNTVPVVYFYQNGESNHNLYNLCIDLMIEGLTLSDLKDILTRSDYENVRYSFPGQDEFILGLSPEWLMPVTMFKSFCDAMEIFGQFYFQIRNCHPDLPVLWSLELTSFTSFEPE